QITAYAFGFIDTRDAFGRSAAVEVAKGAELGDRRYRDRITAIVVHVDALVCAVPTGHVTELAADAFFGMNAGDDFVIEVEVLPLDDFGQRQPAEILDGSESLFVHPVAQTVDHVLHNAIAIMHGGGTNLHRPATQKDELGGIPPAGNST